MKTIKRERQVRLDELLKYVWGNGINDIEFHSDNDSWIRIDDYGDLVKVYEVEESDLFTITEEVEITEETELNMVVITNDRECYACTDTSIHCLLSEENVLFEDCCVKFICLQNEDGSTGELIWTKERGLID